MWLTEARLLALSLHCLFALALPHITSEPCTLSHCRPIQEFFFPAPRSTPRLPTLGSGWTLACFGQNAPRDAPLTIYRTPATQAAVPQQPESSTFISAMSVNVLEVVSGTIPRSHVGQGIVLPWEPFSTPFLCCVLRFDARRCPTESKTRRPRSWHTTALGQWSFCHTFPNTQQIRQE